MPVQVINNNRGGGLLGTLGTIASLGGMFIPGAQFLTPLGMGLGAANSLMNGNASASTIQGLGGLPEGINGLVTSLGSKAPENIAQQEMSDEELLRRGWGAYGRFM